MDKDEDCYAVEWSSKKTVHLAPIIAEELS